MVIMMRMLLMMMMIIKMIGIYEPINRMLLAFFFLHKLTSECLWPKSQRHTTRLAIHLLYVLSNVRISIRKL